MLVPVLPMPIASTQKNKLEEQPSKTQTEMMLKLTSKFGKVSNTNTKSAFFHATQTGLPGQNGLSVEHHVMEDLLEE